MNDSSIEGALRSLRDKINKSIEESEKIVLLAGLKGQYAAALTLQSEILGRKSVVYIIDEMLDNICGTREKS